MSRFCQAPAPVAPAPCTSSVRTGGPERGGSTRTPSRYFPSHTSSATPPAIARFSRRGQRIGTLNDVRPATLEERGRPDACPRGGCFYELSSRRPSEER